MSLVNLVLELTGNFHEGDLSFSYGYVYVAIIRNLSQCWALYCLVLFYHATAEPLAPIKPFPKFVAIKLVVFATFWQAIVIDIMEEMRWINLDTWRFGEGICVAPLEGAEEEGRRILEEAMVHCKGEGCGAGEVFAEGIEEELWNSTERGCVEHGWLWSHPTEDVCFDGTEDECREGSQCIEHICFAAIDEEKFLEDVSKGLQDVLVCIEMFIAAMAHSWCFTYKAHRPISHKKAGEDDHEDGPVKMSTTEALREMANWQDVSEMGLGKMIKDTRAFGRGVSQGMKSPATLEYYWPNAQQLTTADLALLLQELEGEQERRDNKAILKKVPILGQLTDEQLDAVVLACEPAEYDYKDKIISEGDTGFDMFVLTKGGAAAFKDGVNGGGAIMRYQRGQFFGEKALLNSEPRAASVVAERGGAKVLRLSREAYEVVLANATVAERLGDLTEHYDVSEAQLEAKRLQLQAKVEAAQAAQAAADAEDDAAAAPVAKTRRGISFGDDVVEDAGGGGVSFGDEEPSGPPPPPRQVGFGGGGVMFAPEPEPAPRGITFAAADNDDITAL